MTIGTLSSFLTELSKSFAVLPGAGDSAPHLRELASAFHPFSAQSLSDFVAFLHKAEEYRKSGTVAVDPEGIAALRAAVLSVQAAAGDASRDGDLDSIQDQVADSLVAVGKASGLTVGKPKRDAKWLTTVRNRAEALKTVEKLNELATRITSVESLQEDAVLEELTTMEGIAPDVLKAAAIQSGVPASTKAKGRPLVLAVLATLTKLPLDAKAKTAKAKPQADDATVLTLTSELRDTLSRVTDNPHSVSDEDIEGILAKVEGSGLSDQQAKDIAVALTGVKESTKKKAFLALRGKLTAAKRILESRKS